MEEVKENIKCNICKEENEKGTHYCKNCGKNLSDMIEKTDAFFFISGLMKWIGIFLWYIGNNLLFVNYFFGIFGIKHSSGNLFDWSGNLFAISAIAYGIAIIFIILSFCIKKHSLDFKERGIFMAVFGTICLVISNFIIVHYDVFDETFVIGTLNCVVAAILFILSVRLKKHTLKLCKQNLQVK